MTIMIPVEHLKKFTDMVSPIAHEVLLNVSNEGIIVTAIDESTVAMVHAKLNTVAFGSLPDEPIKFAVGLEKIGKALRLADAEDIVMLSPTEGTLEIDVGTSLSMSLRHIDGSRIREPNVPNVKYASAFTMEGSELRRIIRASEGMGYTLTFTISHKGVNISAEGDVDKVRLSVSPDNIEFVEDGEYSSTIALEYVTRIGRVISPSDEIRIEMSQDYPVMMSTKNKYLEVTYIIAPRIEYN